MSGGIERLRQELADHDSRQLAGRMPRPGWQEALDDLLTGNYHDEKFWKHLQGVMLGNVSDDEMSLVRAFYARKCRICGRPLHETWRTCNSCGADNPWPEVIPGSVVSGELPGGHDSGSQDQD
jgi:hypothetical protein